MSVVRRCPLRRFPKNDFILNQSVPEKSVWWKEVSAVENASHREVSLYFAKSKYFSFAAMAHRFRYI